MTDALAPGAPARLYSETPTDERGNFRYVGDLYRQREPTDALRLRIADHLAKHFTDTRFAVRRDDRRIIAELLDTPGDLTGRDAQNGFTVKVMDQMHRFGSTTSNVYQDYLSTTFYAAVSIGRPYWAALAARRGQGNPVEATLSLAAFKKQLRAGDKLKLVAASHGRNIGLVRVITAVRSKDLILEGPTYLTLPRSAAFASDGRLVRIAIGTEHDPDAHLLYEWLPQAG